jgi:hypothetical protein
VYVVYLKIKIKTAPCEKPKRTKSKLSLATFYQFLELWGKDRDHAREVPSRKPAEARDFLKPKRKYYLGFVDSGPRYHSVQNDIGFPCLSRNFD